VPVDPCFIISNIFDYNCTTENTEFSIFPWQNGDIDVSNFSSILSNRVNNLLLQNGLTLNDCVQNSVESNWFVDLRIGGNIIIQEQYYTGYGLTDVPSNTEWRNALIQYLPQLYNFGFNFFLNGNLLTINSLNCTEKNIDEEVSLNTGINISINCLSN
jgi:hypothetical protein